MDKGIVYWVPQLHSFACDHLEYVLLSWNHLTQGYPGIDHHLSVKKNLYFIKYLTRTPNDIFYDKQIFRTETA